MVGSVCFEATSRCTKNGQLDGVIYMRCLNVQYLSCSRTEISVGKERRNTMHGSTDVANRPMAGNREMHTHSSMARNRGM